jgi:hypothetical protein
MSDQHSDSTTVTTTLAVTDENPAPTLSALPSTDPTNDADADKDATDDAAAACPKITCIKRKTPHAFTLFTDRGEEVTVAKTPRANESSTVSAALLERLLFSTVSEKYDRFKRDGAVFSSGGVVESRQSYKDSVVAIRGINNNSSTTSYLFPSKTSVAAYNDFRLVSIQSWDTVGAYVASSVEIDDVENGLAVLCPRTQVDTAEPHSISFPHGVLELDGVRQRIVVAERGFRVVAQINLPPGIASHDALRQLISDELSSKFANFAPVTVDAWRWCLYVVDSTPGSTDPISSPDSNPIYKPASQQTARRIGNHPIFGSHALIFKNGAEVHEMSSGKVIERVFGTPDESGTIVFPELRFCNDFLTSQLSRLKEGVRFYVSPVSTLYKHAPLSAISEVVSVQSAYVHSRGRSHGRSKEHLVAHPRA